MKQVTKLPLYLFIGFTVFFAWNATTFASPNTYATRPNPSSRNIGTPTFKVIGHNDLATLLSAKRAETELFAYLNKRTAKPLGLLAHPHNISALGSWFFARQPVSHDPAVVYPILYENLLIAHGLLSARDIDRQRLGLIFARYSGLNSRLNLQDYTLDALICEAFLVPHLDIAYPENGHTVSRRQILEDTYNAYAGTGEFAHQTTTLLFLLRYADSPNTKNWARLMLAQSYEQAKNYGQAIAFLKTTDPVDQTWLVRLQREQGKQSLRKTNHE